MQNPQDYPEVAGDTMFNYGDGFLAGLMSAGQAIRRIVFAAPLLVPTLTRQSLPFPVTRAMLISFALGPKSAAAELDKSFFRIKFHADKGKKRVEVLFFFSTIG